MPENSSSSTARSNRKASILCWSAITLAAFILLGIYLSQPSEGNNQFLFGLSLVRFMIGAVFLALALLSAGLTYLSIYPRAGWQSRVEGRSTDLLASSNGLYALLTTLYFILLVTATTLLLGILPAAKPIAFLAPLIVRINTLLIWILLSSVFWLLLLAWTYAERIRSGTLFSPLKLTAWGLMLLAVYILLVSDYREAAFVLSLRGFESPLIGLGAYFLVAASINQYFSGSRHRQIINQLLLLGGIFLTTFVFYGHIAAWIGWVDKARYGYWNLLADQFLRGKVYLENPPTTHDLAFFNNKWYIPMPPLPGILMIPLAYLVGGENISTGDFSIFFCAINSVLAFSLLDELIKRKWINLSRRGALWLVILFAFGTNHLWVGLNGRAWFVSQILAVTMLALAALGALKSWSPWLIGASIGLAITARPNSIMFWPFPFAIAMQIANQREKINLGRLLNWTVKSAMPIGLAIVGLLLYNHARFGNYLDFGYTLLSGDPGIVDAAKTFGIFSPHFIPHNLEVMFLYLPTLQRGSLWPISPSGAGMSIFLATPPLIYLFHRYEKQWWILGAWASVFFMFALLILYHNTGAHQFGYRYILDMLVPLTALLAVSFDKKIPWHFIALTILSIIINIYGAAWFMNA